MILITDGDIQQSLNNLTFVTYIWPGINFLGRPYRSELWECFVCCNRWVMRMKSGIFLANWLQSIAREFVRNNKHYVYNPRIPQFIFRLRSHSNVSFKYCQVRLQTCCRQRSLPAVDLIILYVSIGYVFLPCLLGFGSWDFLSISSKAVFVHPWPRKTLSDVDSHPVRNIFGDRGGIDCVAINTLALSVLKI